MDGCTISECSRQCVSLCVQSYKDVILFIDAEINEILKEAKRKYDHNKRNDDA